MNSLIKIKENTEFVEVYHLVSKASEEYYRLSVNIPKALLEVTQHIHGRFDSALHNIYCAANNRENKIKLSYINQANLDLFFQYSSFEYLVKVHAISVGQANLVLEVLRDAILQLSKWKKSVLNSCGSQKLKG